MKYARICSLALLLGLSIAEVSQAEYTSLGTLNKITRPVASTLSPSCSYRFKLNTFKDQLQYRDQITAPASLDLLFGKITDLSVDLTNFKITGSGENSDYLPLGGPAVGIKHELTVRLNLRIPPGVDSRNFPVAQPMAVTQYPESDAGSAMSVILLNGALIELQQDCGIPTTPSLFPSSSPSPYYSSWSSPSPSPSSSWSPSPSPSYN